MIAGHGRFKVPAATATPDPMRDELGEIPACRRPFSALIGVRRQQLKQGESPTIRARTLKAIPFRQAELAGPDQLRDQLVRDDPALGCGRAPAADHAKAPRQGPGPGVAGGAAGTGQAGPGSIASPVGSAPVARDSGPRRNRRVIEGGRSLVRPVLYMVRSRARGQEWTYARKNAALVGRGKAPRVALVAIIRRMIVTLNAMLEARTACKKAVVG